MTDFTLHDKDTAPEQSKPLLDNSHKAFGMIPGLHAVMAEAPGLLEGYQQLHQLVLDSSFDNDEKTVVWQTINVENACHYCVPAHTGIAKSMKVSDDITNALRDERRCPVTSWKRSEPSPSRSCANRAMSARRTWMPSMGQVTGIAKYWK